MVHDVHIDIQEWIDKYNLFIGERLQEEIRPGKNDKQINIDKGSTIVHIAAAYNRADVIEYIDEQYSVSLIHCCLLRNA